jgi:hypothetical protein
MLKVYTTFEARSDDIDDYTFCDCFNEEKTYIIPIPKDYRKFKYIKTIGYSLDLEYNWSSHLPQNEITFGSCICGRYYSLRDLTLYYYFYHIIHSVIVVDIENNKN